MYLCYILYFINIKRFIFYKHCINIQIATNHICLIRGSKKKKKSVSES